MNSGYRLTFAPAENPTTVRVRWDDARDIAVPLAPLPPAFLDWQIKTRIANLRFFLTGQGEHDFAVHAGYMATLGAGGAFAVNAAAKGIGLLPKGELMALTEEIGTLTSKASDHGEEGTRKERLERLLRLYHEMPMDARVLTTIEIYGKQTWRNVLADPRCAVLFSSYRNTSFAVNGVVEILGREHPVYRYVVAVHDLFHPPRGPRREHPAVYRIWTSEAWDKTPGPHAGERLV